MEVWFTTMGFGNNYRVKHCIRIHHLLHCYMWSIQNTHTTNVHLIWRCIWWSRDGLRHREMRNKAVSEKSISLSPNLQAVSIYTFGTRLSETWLEESIIPESGESIAAFIAPLSKKMTWALRFACFVLAFAPSVCPVSLLVPYYSGLAQV